MFAYTLRVGGQLIFHAAARRAELASSTGKGDRMGQRDAHEAFRISMRAWPWLCDAYLHLNNAAYLRLAEDARWAWTARTPLLGEALRHRWSFLVGGADVLYRREIPLMSRFEVVSELLGLDERWLYFAQTFVLADGQIACRILLRAMVRSPRGLVDPRQVAELAEVAIPREAKPEVQLVKELADAQLASISQKRSAAGQAD